MSSIKNNVSHFNDSIEQLNKFYKFVQYLSISVALILAYPYRTIRCFNINSTLELLNNKHTYKTKFDLI